MLQNCQQWRKTVGGDGIDALYNRLDPYDVRPSFLLNLCCRGNFALLTHRTVPRAGRNIQVLVHVFPQGKFSTRTFVEDSNDSDRDGHLRQTRYA
jgi:hypothetical protein